MEVLGTEPGHFMCSAMRNMALGASCLLVNHSFIMNASEQRLSLLFLLTCHLRTDSGRMNLEPSTVHARHPCSPWARALPQSRPSLLSPSSPFLSSLSPGSFHAVASFVLQFSTTAFSFGAHYWLCPIFALDRCPKAYRKICREFWHAAWNTSCFIRY